jgi:hypothetical protein
MLYRFLLFLSLIDRVSILKVTSITFFIMTKQTKQQLEAYRAVLKKPGLAASRAQSINYSMNQTTANNCKL